MPSISKSILILAALQAVGIVAIPIPQLAGEGNACSSVLSSTDNGVGYGVENALDNTANLISSVSRRQLAGEGNACSSILSSTDNGVGYGVKNAEDNTAALISGSSSGTTTNTGGSGAAPAPAPGPKGPPKPKRQLDKIANGGANVLNAAHLGPVADIEKNVGDSVDGQLTDGASQAGAQIGNFEEQTLEGIGKAIPRVKRQGDKIANGFANVLSAAKLNDLADIEKSNGDTLDGQLTDDATNAGAQIGAYEEKTLENAGKAIP
ncbi:hypothetical protein E4T39_08572 [Aureobasidium subglaciale]|nr:hypothetical protein E4T39_08572 [Aureobasidium subglaciale]